MFAKSEKMEEQLCQESPEYIVNIRRKSNKLLTKTVKEASQIGKKKLKSKSASRPSPTTARTGTVSFPSCAISPLTMLATEQGGGGHGAGRSGSRKPARDGGDSWSQVRRGQERHWCGAPSSGRGREMVAAPRYEWIMTRGSVAG